MRKKICLAILAIFITVITASSSYAYFNEKLFIKGANGDAVNVLNIQNGKEEITIDTSNSKWIYDEKPIENGIIKNPSGELKATYSGVKVSNDSNLTSNVELKFSFNSLKEEGTKEDTKAESPEDEDEVDTRPAAENFEVWVGDIDNLGYGYGQGSVDADKDYILSGELPGKNGLNIFPESVAGRGDRNDPDKYDGTDSNGNLTNDAPGTDRRMVTSGFYNFYQKLIGNNKDYNGLGYIKVYIKAHTLPKIHYWDLNGIPGNQNTQFPGREMTDEGNGVYSHTFKDCRSASLLFTINGNKITGDLSITEGEWWYKDGKWYQEDPELIELPQIKFYSFLRAGGYETNNYPLSRLEYTHKDATFYSLTYSNYWLDGKNYEGKQNVYESGLIGPLKKENEKIIGDNGEIFYDGYTDRALRKKYENNSDNNSQYIQNGVNWAELQPAEPITFMYQNKIGTTDNGAQKKVTSATVQIMLNDIQPEPSEAHWSERWNNGDWNTRFNLGSNGIKNIEWQTSYSAKSNVNYQVTLRVKDSYKEPVRVEEWERIINNLDQHGPRANLVTLQVPQRLLYLIEAGEQNGLELLIDDPRDGSKINDSTLRPDVAGGDSYCIDFARLLVNDDISNKVEIEGTVKISGTDTGIKGVKVDNGSGESITTDSQGGFKMSVVPGQVVLNLSHPEYVDRTYTIYNIQENVTGIKITIYMMKATDIAIIPQVKFQGTLTMRKYKHTSSCSGENCDEKDTLVKIDGEDYKQYSFELGQAGIKDEKSEVFTELKIEPGHYYTLDYELKLFSGGDIDKYAKKFNLIFSSDIEAKITQENNPGWSESGEKK